MDIRKANLSDLAAVKAITESTITAIYSHYYPKGAVEYFLTHHSEDSIRKDIEAGRVYLCLSEEQTVTGTITIKGNEICRLFVLPEYQGRGYGSKMLDYAEKVISGQYTEIVLDASLPAKAIYQKRGYREIQFLTIAADHGDFLCYDLMKKQL